MNTRRGGMKDVGNAAKMVSGRCANTDRSAPSVAAKHPEGAMTTVSSSDSPSASAPAVDRITDSIYGFAWGPMLVTRMATLPNSRRCLGVSTDAGRQLEIYVSATGKSVVVFLDGERLT